MKKFLLPALALAILFSACVPSLQPLYTAETTIFREELVGIWKEKPEDEDESWTFTKGENNTYLLNIKDRKTSSKFEVRLVKLGEHLFLDLFPSGETINDSPIDDFYKAALIPGHLILKVKLGAKLEMRLLEPDKLATLLKAEPKSLAHTFIEKDRLIITATTADLQAFFRKHAASDEIWGEPALMQKLVL